MATQFHDTDSTESPAALWIIFTAVMLLILGYTAFLAYRQTDSYDTQLNTDGSVISSPNNAQSAE